MARDISNPGLDADLQGQAYKRQSQINRSIWGSRHLEDIPRRREGYRSFGATQLRVLGGGLNFATFDNLNTNPRVGP